MCSGKSSTGRTLARKLGWPHVDTDAAIVERTGLSVDEIFRSRGEAAFRKMERDLVAELPPERDLVLSTGGGLVLNGETMEILRVQGPVFWLQVDPQDVHERCQRPWAAKRPLLSGTPNLADRIQRLMEEREPLYRRWGQPVQGGFSHPRDAGRHIFDLLALREEFAVYFGRGSEM
jgi:shikimate kinase/3-dehydroquinate synthase